MKMSKILFAPVLVSALALSGLAHAQAGTATTPAPAAGTATTTTPAPVAATPTDTTAAAPATKVNDREILQILMTANDGEIDQAKQAKKISKSKPVKDFADMMVLEHKQVQKDLKSWASKTKIKVAPSKINDDLKNTAKASIEKLKRVSGKEFDRDYAADQVAMHEGLLAQLDSTLIPNAQDQELKDLLAKIRTSVSMHLEKAKNLQTTIGTANG
jgi:putative membrane protein